MAYPFREVFLENQETRKHQEEGDKKDCIGRHDEITVQDNNDQIMTAQNYNAVFPEILKHTRVLHFSEKNGQGENERKRTDICENNVLHITR